MDERGEVKEPPPFEQVAADWAEIGEQEHHNQAALGGEGCLRYSR